MHNRRRPPAAAPPTRAASGDAATFGRRVATGVWMGAATSLALALLEALFVVAGKPLAFDSGAERVRFAFCMLGLFLGAGALLGAFAGICAHLVAGAAARLGGEEQARRWTARLGTLLAAPVVVLGVTALMAGRRAIALPARPLMFALAVALALACVYAAIGLADNALRVARPGARAGLAAAAVAAAIVLHVVDERALPRLYPAFHAGLEVFEGAALLLGVALALRLRKLSAGWPALLLALGALASSRWALRQLSFWPALRAVAFEETTAAARLLALASALHVAPRAVVPPPRLSPRAPPGPAALPPGPRMPDADVFLITVDAMRADRLGPRVAPRLAALAAQGARFEHAYSPVPHTSFAITSLLTGKYIYSLAALGEALDAHETLADLFKRERYKTAAFFPPSVFYIDHDRFSGLEQDAYRFEYVKYEYMAAPGRTDQVIRFLESEHPQRVFVWVHYLDPHEPYDLHGPDAKPDPDGGASIPLTAVDRYDGEVTFTDAEVGRLVDWIHANRRGAILAFTADHGEEFGEHGGRYHGTTLYEEQVRVPLFFVGPQIVPRRIEAPVALVDVAPTLLSIADMAAPVKMRGHDLGPWMGRAPAAESGIPPAFAELGPKKMIALGDQRLICDVSRDFCELYDLASDAGEQRNLAGREPERVAEWRRRVDEWMDGQSRYERDPGLGERELAQRALERCRLGDASAAPAVVRLLGDPDPALSEMAARALLRLPDEPAIHPAILAAARARPDDVLIATLALRAGDRALADPLARLAGQAPTPGALAPPLVGEVAVALAAIDHPAAVPLLHTALAVVDDEDLECRILRALGKSGSRAALPALLEHLDQSVRTRDEVVRALGALGDRRAVEPLIAAIAREHYVTARAEMARVLGELGDRRAVPALTKLARHEAEPVVNNAIALSLARLRARPAK